MKKEKSEKQKTISAREAAQDFIRPFIIKGDNVSFLDKTKLRHETKNYSAHIDGVLILLTKLNGEEIKEEFVLKEIMKDVLMEHSHSKGMIGIQAATAKEAYEKWRMEVKLLLKQLNTKLKIHRDGFKMNPLHWGYVGDLAHIQKALNELVTFLH